MKAKTQVKAGIMSINRNTRSLRVKSGIKAGGVSLGNHNERQLRSPGLRVKTGVKAGPLPNLLLQP